jgi:hypothetical protein
MSRPGPHFLILVLVVGLLLLRESQQSPLRALDEGFTDLLASYSETPAKKRSLTLVEIDDPSLQAHPWPWNPLDFALFFQAANTLHAGTAAAAEVLNWEPTPERSGLPAKQEPKLAQYRTLLREHLLRTPKCLLGAYLGFPRDPQIIPPLQEVPRLERVQGDIRLIPEFTNVAFQSEPELQLALPCGFLNLPEAPGRHRTIPLLLRYRGQVVPAFALQAILLSEKLTLEDVSVEMGVKIRLGGLLEIPIDTRGEMRVHFGAPKNRCGFEDFLLSSSQLDAGDKPAIAQEKFTGKLLLLARTDTPSQTLKLGPGHRGAPGELLAAGIATIQSRLFLKSPPTAFGFLLVGLAMLGAWMSPRCTPIRVTMAALVSLGIYAALAAAAFTAQQWALPVSLPTGLAVFVAGYRWALGSGETAA